MQAREQDSLSATVGSQAERSGGLGDTALRTLGIRAPHLVDAKLLSDVSQALGLDDEIVQYAASLEDRRAIGRAVHTLQETALIGAIGQLGTPHPETAIPLFGLSLLTSGGLFIEASRRDRMVGTILKKINSKVQEFGLGRETEENISTVIQQGAPLLSANERMMYTRPGDLVLFSAAEMLALGMNKPEALPWLAGGIGLLLTNMGIVGKVYGPKQAAFLEVEQKYLRSEITYQEYYPFLKSVSNVTFIINSITGLFKSMGLLLGSTTLGMAGVMLANVNSASGMIASNSQNMIGASQARETLDKELRGLLSTLDSQIKTDTEYDTHKAQLEPRAKDQGIWLQLLGSGIKEALVLDMSWKLGSENKQAQGVIDFSQPELGAFYLFGQNGSGKSSLVRSILQMDNRHTGFVGLWKSDDLSQNSSLLDLHSLKLPELRNLTRMFSVSGIKAHSHNFLDYNNLDLTSGKMLLEKYGFGNLSRLLKSDISSLRDKSEGEQIILGVLAFLERAKADGAKLVVLDEIFGKVDQQNVSKMRKMIDDYVAQGLMTIVVSQDPFKMGSELNTIRGAVIDQAGLTYYDQSIFTALAKLREKDPNLDMVNEVAHPRAWVSALGMSLESDLTDERVWEHIISNPAESLERLDLLFKISATWADGTGHGLLAGFRSFDPVEIGYISTGMIRKWERIFAEETVLVTEGDVQKTVLNETRSLEFIRELKLLKQIHGLLSSASETNQTKAPIDYYATDVARGIKHIAPDAYLSVQMSWFDEEMQQFFARNHYQSSQAHQLAGMILERDLYHKLDCVPAVEVVSARN